MVSTRPPSHPSCTSRRHNLIIPCCPHLTITYRNWLVSSVQQTTSSKLFLSKNTLNTSSYVSRELCYWNALSKFSPRLGLKLISLTLELELFAIERILESNFDVLVLDSYFCLLSLLAQNFALSTPSSHTEII